MGDLGCLGVRLYDGEKGLGVGPLLGRRKGNEFQFLVVEDQVGVRKFRQMIMME